MSTLALTALVLSASGCHAHEDRIAVIPRTTATLLWEPMHQGIMEAARQHGVHVYWNAPPDEGDTEKQMGLYGSLQRGGYRGFIFSPDETLAARSAVLDTVGSGIPVVIVDDELGPSPSQGLSYVSNDEAAGALMAARQVLYLLHGRGTIAVTGIIPKSESSISRDEAFEQTLGTVAPGVRIVERQFGDTVLTHQEQIAQQIMLRPDPVDMIVALSATATRGAYYAKLSAAGHPSVAIIGFDQDLVLPLETGDVDAIIGQDTRTIGRIAMQNLEAQMRGERVPGITRVPPILLTRETMASGTAKRLLEFPEYSWKDQ